MNNARTILKVLGWIWLVLILPFAWISIQVIEQLPRKGFPQNLYDSTLGFLFLPGLPIILTCSVLGLLLLATIVIGIFVLKGKQEEAAVSPGSIVTTNTVRDNQGAASQIGSTGNAMIIQNSPGAIINSPVPQIDNSKLTAEQQKALFHRYLNNVISKNKDLNPTGIHQSQALLSVNVPLDDIFIHIRAVSDRPVYDIGIEQQKLLEEIEQVRRSLDLDPLEREDYIQRLRAAIWHSQLGEELFVPRLSTEVKIEDVLQRLAPNRSVAVILGTPGSGKSTTIRWLGLHMARASCHSDYELPEHLAPILIPIFLTIGDYAKAISASPSAAQQITNVKEFLWNEWKKISPDLPTLLEDALLNGRCLLLFDGLDEVTSDSLRSRVRKDLFDFISLYLLEQDNAQLYNRVLITSRIVGYEPGPFAPFAQYTLLDLDDEQIRQFLTTWCPAVERYQARSLQGMQEQLTLQQEQRAQQEGDSQRDRLLEALQQNPGIRRLAVNPLMLTILALIQKSGRRLPHRRIELYQTITLTLLDNWNQFRGGVIFSQEEIDLAEEALCEFAYRLHSRDLPLTEREVFAITRETLAHYYSRKLEQIHLSEVERFIDTLRSSSGLFVERGQGLYGFIHRTFQEYYVMRYLVDKQHYPLVDKNLPAGEDLKTFVTHKCHISTWREPLLLLIAYKSEQKDRDERQQASALIETILAAQDKYDTLLQRHLLLAASGLIDCNTWYIHIPLQQEVANQLLDIYGNTYGAGRYTELQKDIENIFLLWLRGQPQNSGQQPPLLEAWYTALCDHTNEQRQYGAAKLLASIAPDVPSCPAIVLDTLVPPLLNLAGVQDWYRQELTCPPKIQSRLFTISVRPSSPDIEDYALVTLRLLDSHGPSGWLYTDWIRWNEEQPDLLQHLTQHSLELDYLLTPAAFPKPDDINWDGQFEISKEWPQLAQRSPSSLQIQLLQASSAARYPQAILFKRLLSSERSVLSLAWQVFWDHILQQEMQQGQGATYLPCLLLRLLLLRDDGQLQGLVSELMQALVTQGTQVQTLITLSNLFYLSDLRNLHSEYVLYELRKLREMLDLFDHQELLKSEQLAILRLGLDLRMLRNPLIIRLWKQLLILLTLHDEGDLSNLPNFRNLHQLINREQLIEILCSSLLKAEEKVISPALFTIYGVLTSFDQVPSQVTEQIQRTITTLENQELSSEQRQLLQILQRHLSGGQSVRSTPRSLPSSTPDQRILQLHALQQQQPVLNRSSIEEILAACTDTRKTTKETWGKLSPGQTGGQEGGSVGEFAWQLLSQAWSMDKAAQQVVGQALDDDNPIICAASALLLQHGKELTIETKQVAGVAITRILADEERSRRPLGPLEWDYSKIWRLDDVLFETLRSLAEG